MAHQAYLDSSVVLRKLLRQSAAIPDLKPWRLFSSQLLDVEVRRTLLSFHAERMLSAQRLAQRMNEWILFRGAIDLVPLSDGILQRAAEPFPTLLRSLDAIHLATALGWAAQMQEPVTVLTHDEKLGIAASACGFPVVP
jgi:predicted nucleic acid-binding protein